MKKRRKFIRNQCFVILYVIAIFTALSFGYDEDHLTTTNLANSTSLQSYNLLVKYNPKVAKTKRLNSFIEVLREAENQPVIYQGTMTAYGPDCVGCSGYVACAPNPNVKKSVYYKDNTYGKIRIVAADKNIPCGTIVKVRNSTVADEFTAIVLDRGGAIKNTLMDLLYDTEKNTYSFGRQQVEYEIIRWGW